MTDVDELLERLRRLGPIEIEADFSRSVHRRGLEQLRSRPLSSKLAAGLVLGAVVAYLGWALQFAGGLYR